MKKVLLIVLLVFITGNLSIFANPEKIHQISLGEEDESVLFFNDSELYFMLPYQKKMTKLDRKLLSYDKDGFLKLTLNGRQALIIDGEMMKQVFCDFRSDGKNNYDLYAENDDSKGGNSPFQSYNVKSISASSSLKENQYGHDIVYAPINLFRAFETGCRCHPYWWNNAHIPWVEGVKGTGINENISIEFNEPVYGFAILNGYADVNNMKLYKENSRVKKLKVEDLTNSLDFIMEFEDKVYFNYMELSKPSKSIKMTILEVYEGTKYQDTCISAMVDYSYAPDKSDWDMKNFIRYKSACSESNDMALFEQYFEAVSQPVGDSAIYEKTETAKKAVNLFNKSYYQIDNYKSLDISERDDRFKKFWTWTLDKTVYNNQTSDMFIDEYGYKHLKLYNENQELEHHFTIIDTNTVTVVQSEYPWIFEPNLFCYSFFEHNTDFLKDDKSAVEKYFETPSMFLNNGEYIKGLKASSFLKEGSTSYEPENTTRIYNKPARFQQIKRWNKQIKPWVEGKKDDGIGETIEFDMSYSAREHWDIRILNGYADPLKPNLFRENNRIKKALLETDTGIKEEIEFRDEVEFTQVILPNNVKHVKLTILEVYKGTKYRDTCITSIEVNQKMNEK